MTAPKDASDVFPFTITGADFMALNMAEAAHVWRAIGIIVGRRVAGDVPPRLPASPS